MIKRPYNRHRLSLTLIIIVLACIGILAANIYAINQYHEHNRREASIALEQVLAEQLQRDALIIAQAMSSQLREPVSKHNIRAIYDILRESKQNPDIGYTYIYDLDGNVIHDGTSTLYHYGKPISALLPSGLRAAFTPLSQRIGRNIHASVPIETTKGTVAGLRISLAFSHAEANLESLGALLKQQQLEQKQQLIRSLVLIEGLALFVMCGFIFWLYRKQSKPLQKLADACLRIDGPKPPNFQLDRKDDLGVIASTLETLSKRLHKSRHQIDQLSDLDPLTQLSNRRMFTEELEQLIQWAKHEKRQFGLLFIDLDDFRQINESAGHAVGDQLLQEVAARLTHLVHSNTGLQNFPLPEKLLLARLGGDEFVTIIPSFDSIEEVSELAADIIAVLEPNFDIDDQSHPVSASIGITIFPEDGSTAMELLKHSDIALYAAKNAGRNRFRYFETKMNRAVLEHQLVRQGVSAALEEQQFHLRYQPIFDLQSQEIIGAEAVIRWLHPTQGELSPASFIPQIERSEQIIPVTLWVLEHACRDLSQYFLPYNPDFKLSINISGAAFLNSQISANIPLLINTHSIPGHALHLELTETSLMADFEACRQVILNWKELGVNVWIDDFGTGYSSLSYLHQLPIDGLKIDQSFVADMAERDTCQIVEIIIALAKTLNLDTVSEGIETDEDLQRLKHLGNQYGQGYFLSKPLSADDLTRWLAGVSIAEGQGPSAS